MKYLLDKVRYVMQVSFGGLVLAAFSFNALSYSGEIEEMAEHFTGYAGYYFPLFLTGYFLASLAYTFFFIHKVEIEWKEALKVEGLMQAANILVLPYLVNYEYIHKWFGLSLFYLFLFVASSLRVIMLTRHLMLTKSRNEVFRFWLLAFIVFSGIILRLILLFSSQKVVGSEEAIMGLMARHILFDRETYVFLWGQPYMGSIEALLAVPIFLLFGASSLTLKLVPFIFSILFIIASYFLVSLTLGEDTALISTSLISISPVFLTVFSTLANAYIENLFYGALVLILSYQIAYGSKRRRQWYFFPLLGFIAGIAFWNNLTSTIYITAAFLFLAFAWRRWSSGFLPKILALLGGLLFGSFPLWIFNLKHQGVTFKFIAGGLQASADLLSKIEQIFINFKNLLGVAKAIVGGGQNPVTDFIVYLLYAISFFYALYYFVSGWVGSAFLHHYFERLILKLGLKAPSIQVKTEDTKTEFVREEDSKKQDRENGLKIFLILTLVLVIFFCVSRYGSLNEARYALALYLTLPAFLAFLLRNLVKRKVILAAVLLAVVIFSNLLGNVKDIKKPPPQPELIASFLHSNNISYAYTDFWTAYQLTFISKEKIISYAVTGPNVYPPYVEKVKAANSKQIAILFDKDDDYKQFEEQLLRLSVKFKKKRLAGKIIFYSFSKNIESFLWLQNLEELV